MSNIIDTHNNAFITICNCMMSKNKNQQHISLSSDDDKSILDTTEEEKEALCRMAIAINNLGKPTEIYMMLVIKIICLQLKYDLISEKWSINRIFIMLINNGSRMQMDLFTEGKYDIRDVVEMLEGNYLLNIEKACIQSKGNKNKFENLLSELDETKNSNKIF